MSPRPSLLLISSISVPAVALLISTYLYNYPLSASKSRKIIKTGTVCPSFASSNTIRKIINPRHYDAMIDSRSIRLSRQEVAGLSDEEILARFLKGFFGGWIFFPERNLIAILGALGVMFRTEFSGIPTDGAIVSSFPLGLSRSSLPPKYARLFGGNFLVLDLDIKPESLPPKPPGEQGEGSFIDVGFGDNRRTFAGVHRFEVLRDVGAEKGEEVTILYSHMSCNPTVKDAKFPEDGVAEVLRN